MPARAGAVPRRRTRVLALPEARWAAAAAVFFPLALPVQLTGAPAWTRGPLYALSHVTGGWEPGWEGLKALKERTLVGPDGLRLLRECAWQRAAAEGRDRRTPSARRWPTAGTHDQIHRDERVDAGRFPGTVDAVQ